MIADTARSNMAVRMVRLEHHRSAIELVARWYFDEWGVADPDATIERIADELLDGLGVDALPSCWVAVTEGRVVGTAMLKHREVPAFHDFEHWLGGVYVDPECRGRGVARQLIQRCIDEAAALGLNRLYLQTEEHNVGLYTRFGWSPARLPPGVTHPRPVMVRTRGR